MSHSSEREYTCPYCGRKFTITTWDSVNAAADPDLRDRCVDGDIFRFSCPHCKRDFMVQYPLVYSDPVHKFVIWVSTAAPGIDLHEAAKPLIAQGYTLRRCETIREFTEKIQILEDGVSDVMAELAKFDSFIDFIRNKKGTREDITGIEYQRTENGVMKITVRADDKSVSMLIPVSMLEEEMESRKEDFRTDDADFPLVNSDWITQIYRESEGSA